MQPPLEHNTITHQKCNRNKFDYVLLAPLAFAAGLRLEEQQRVYRECLSFLSWDSHSHGHMCTATFARTFHTSSI
jgi:hypothetical protein